jgi:hypothetical protein
MSAKSDEARFSSELWNCPSAFQMLCPREWKLLSRTDDPRVRYCSACAQNVYLCSTPREFVYRGNKGQCVAVPSDCTPKLATRFLMGRIAPSAIEDLVEEQKTAQEYWADVMAQKPAFEAESLAALAEKIKCVQEGKPG